MAIGQTTRMMSDASSGVSSTRYVPRHSLSYSRPGNPVLPRQAVFSLYFAISCLASSLFLHTLSLCPSFAVLNHLLSYRGRRICLFVPRYSGLSNVNVNVELAQIIQDEYATNRLAPPHIAPKGGGSKLVLHLSQLTHSADEVRRSCRVFDSFTIQSHEHIELLLVSDRR